MRAEVIFTGTELLLGQILNTSAQFLQQVLASLGVDLYYQITVGDNLERLTEAINSARGRAELIIIAGGLGPTEDDLSREALGRSLGIPLKQSAQALKVVRRFFDERRVPMPENNLKQALVPMGGVVLDNPLGTAPGLVLEKEGKTYFLLPGPPSEFCFMVKEELVPYLSQKSGGERKIIKSRVLKLCGIGESMVDERLGELLRSANPTLAPTAKFTEVHLRITAKAGTLEEALCINKEMEDKVRLRVGEYIFGTDEETLADALGKKFMPRGLSLATIETTFTGGLLAYRLTSARQAKKYFRGGCVLGLENNPLSSVSGNKKEQTVQLALLGREKTRADICVAVTEEVKEQTREAGDQALVYIATNVLGRSKVGEFKLWGTAEDRKERAVQITMALLWRLKV